MFCVCGDVSSQLHTLEGDRPRRRVGRLASGPGARSQCGHVQHAPARGDDRAALVDGGAGVSDLDGGGHALITLRAPKPDNEIDETALIKLVGNWGVTAGNDIVVDQVTRLFAAPALGVKVTVPVKLVYNWLRGSMA